MSTPGNREARPSVHGILRLPNRHVGGKIGSLSLSLFLDRARLTASVRSKETPTVCFTPAFEDFFLGTGRTRH